MISGRDTILTPYPDILTRPVSAVPHLLSMVLKKMEDCMERLSFAQALASDLCGKGLARNVQRLARALRVALVMAVAAIAVAGAVALFRSIGAVASYPEVAYAATTAASPFLR